LLPAGPPTLDSVLARAGEYVTAWHQNSRLVIADEAYVQILRPYGSTRTDMMGSGAPLGQLGTPKVREMRSEFALVAATGTDQWQAFRDVVELDGKPLGDRRNRLERALADRSTEGVAEARRISKESLAFDLSTMPHDVNAPTFAMTFLAPAKQKGVAFRKKGEKKVDDVPVWVIEFTETGAPLATRRDGTPQPSRGEIWIEPESGRVVRSRVVFDSLDAYPDMKQHPERYADFPRVTIEVTYKPDARLNMWVPVEMKEAYDRRSDVVTCTATYSNYRRIDRPQ
jgi:hypothetical protein